MVQEDEIPSVKDLASSGKELFQFLNHFLSTVLVR